MKKIALFLIVLTATSQSVSARVPLTYRIVHKTVTQNSVVKKETPREVISKPEKKAVPLPKQTIAEPEKPNPSESIPQEIKEKARISIK